MANEIQELKFQVGEAWKGVYSSSTAYGLANVVQDPTGLSVYRSLKSGNVGHPVSDRTWWFCIIDLSSIKEESDRIKALNDAIAEDEALRVAAEELRQQHETARVEAETQRNESEQARISAEQARVNAESSRATAEQQRITAEQGRVSAESARVQAEQARVLAETLRANAEDARAANEQNRVAAEQQRIANEQTRETQYTADHTRAESDHETAVQDNAQMTELVERADADHVQAGQDHTRAESDHTTAASDHTTAASDHTQAGQDHTQAGSDHTRAESDHTRAESDHAAVEVYVDSLGAFDISAYHATGGVLAKYSDLAAALGTNGANIPDALRKGGMSVKFVQSSDNKYVQYRLMSSAWSTTVSDWQGVDADLKANKDGYYETLGAGIATSLAGNVSDNTFIHRQTGDNQSIASGTARLEHIKGNTVKWNQLYSNEVPTAKTNHKYFISEDNSGTISKSISTTISYTADSTNRMCIDLTQIFGSGNEPATVEAFESWLSTNVGIKNYYAYDAGTLIPCKMTGIKTTGGSGASAWESIANIDVTTITGKLNGSGNSVTIFPDGMKRVGNVCDEIKVVDGVVKAIKKVGAVDLGTLAWNETYQYYFNSENISLAKHTASDICSRLQFKSSSSLNRNDVGYFTWLGATIMTPKGDYATAAAFKTAMSGVYLYYELATYQEYILEGVDFPMGYKEENGGSEEVLVPAGETEGAVTSCAPTLGLVYPYDAVSAIDNINTILDNTDITPTKGSPDLITSGGVFKAVNVLNGYRFFEDTDVIPRKAVNANTGAIVTGGDRNRIAKFYVEDVCNVRVAKKVGIGSSLVLFKYTSSDYSTTGAEKITDLQQVDCIITLEQGYYCIGWYSSSLTADIVPNEVVVYNYKNVGKTTNIENNDDLVNGRAAYDLYNKTLGDVITYSLEKESAITSWAFNKEISAGEYELELLTNTSAGSSLRFYNASGTEILYIAGINGSRKIVLNEPASKVDGYTAATGFTFEMTPTFALLGRVKVLEDKVGEGILFYNPQEVYEPLISSMKYGRYVRGSGKKNCISLLQFSDIHGNATNVARLMQFKEKYSSYINDVICTGDIVAEKYQDANILSSYENMLLTLGNHDAWIETYDEALVERQVTSSLWVVKPTYCYDKFFSNNISNWSVTQPSDAVANGKCYYYKDYTVSSDKIRLIVLDCMHYNIGSDLVDNVSVQNTWLEGVLADAAANHTPVVIAVHYWPGSITAANTIVCSYTTTDGLYSDYMPSLLANTVAAFITNGGEFICYITGHSHSDVIGTVPEHPEQMFIAVDTASNTNPCGNSVIIGKGQDCFNIISFDVNDKLVKVVRVGRDVTTHLATKRRLVYRYAQFTDDFGTHNIGLELSE